MFLGSWRWACWYIVLPWPGWPGHCPWVAATSPISSVSWHAVHLCAGDMHCEAPTFLWVTSALLHTHNSTALQQGHLSVGPQCAAPSQQDMRRSSSMKLGRLPDTTVMGQISASAWSRSIKGKQKTKPKGSWELMPQYLSQLMSPPLLPEWGFQLRSFWRQENLSQKPT